MDVGVDVWDYTPVSWEILAYKMSLKHKREYPSGREGEVDNVSILRKTNIELARRLQDKENDERTNWN